MKSDTMKRMIKAKAIVEVGGVASDVMLYTVEALRKGEIKAVQIPFCTIESSGDNEIASKIAGLKKCFGQDVLIGASDVLCDRQVKIAKSAGADFISSPVVNKEILERAKAVNIAAYAGAFTLTESYNAILYGADMVRLLPTKCDGGFNHTATIIKKLPFENIIATGDLKFQDIIPLSEIGIKYYEFGDTVSLPEYAERGEYSAITDTAKRYIDLINKL